MRSYSFEQVGSSKPLLVVIIVGLVMVLLRSGFVVMVVSVCFLGIASQDGVI